MSIAVVPTSRKHTMNSQSHVSALFKLPHLAGLSDGMLYYGCSQFNFTPGWQVFSFLSLIAAGVGFELAIWSVAGGYVDRRAQG